MNARTKRLMILSLAGAVVAACETAPSAPEALDASASLGDVAPPPMARLAATLNLGQVVFDVAGPGCTPVNASTDAVTPLFLVPLSLAVQQITCEDGGTRYHFTLKGLIPNGVYTIWHFPGTAAGGALASHPPDDIHNVFTANRRIAVGPTFSDDSPAPAFASENSERRDPRCTRPPRRRVARTRGFVRASTTTRRSAPEIARGG